MRREPYRANKELRAVLRIVRGTVFYFFIGEVPDEKA